MVVFLILYLVERLTYMLSTRTLTGEETTNGVQNADALTYDQALQLGLAPDGEDAD